MHQARNHVTATEPVASRDGRHWATGVQAVQHPGRLADCALCLTCPDDPEGRR